jgi:hypothetical protein
MSRVTHLLIHATTLLRNVSVEQGPGRFQEDRQPVGGEIRMRVFTASGSDLILAQQMKVTANCVAYFEPDQDVRVDDEFIVAARRYRVLALVPPSIDHHLKTLCESLSQTPTPET